MRLSNPHQAHAADELEALLATPDAHLDHEQLRVLFGPPEAGAFDEVAYFLPRGFELLAVSNQATTEHIFGLTRWVSKHHEELAEANGLEYVKGEVRRALAEWTGSFQVKHHGNRIFYTNYVDNTERVDALIFALVHEHAFSSVAEDFVSRLASSNSSIEAAWFLEYARGQREHPRYPVSGRPMSAEEEAELVRGARAYRREQGMAPDEQALEEALSSARSFHATRSDSITELVRDPRRLQRAFDIVRASDLYATGSTYWRDVAFLLDLAH